MSTRSTLLIKKTQEYGKDNPNNGVKYSQYYHHSDGYLEGVGLELLTYVLKMADEEPKTFSSLYNIDSYLRNNLTRSYEKESFDNIHGDLQYIYLLDFDTGITLSMYKVNYNWMQGLKQDFPQALLTQPTEQLIKYDLIERENYNYYKLNHISYTN